MNVSLDQKHHHRFDPSTNSYFQEGNSRFRHVIIRGRPSIGYQIVIYHGDASGSNEGPNQFYTEDTLQKVLSRISHLPKIVICWNLRP